ncbi:putative phd finger domain [Phaeomoniella chlamydospora]|uniref:Putative phd finger domain n=1 Tax=Phaeomoniella chlamydospora TaxID=158046 RepID=A0A0G2E299_PHACM|nr:putative phd finger domain [Phaeomoniella chlamydospora]
MSLALSAMADSAIDPDAQATITDLLDFTEYYPSDLIRSLTLIRGLDSTYLNNSHAVHDLSRIYSALPSLPASCRPDSAALREQISFHLDRAIDARENTLAEATRAYEATLRNTNRLQSIVSKLKALPKPPSRDPTPQPLISPEAKRSRSGRKIDHTLTQRLTLNPPKYPAALAGHKRKRPLIIPGEPLPAFDPDSPIASTEQSDTEAPASPKGTPDRGLKTVKVRGPRHDGLKTPSRGPRSAAALTPRPEPPPDDAPRGSVHRPWTRLSAYERFRVQKRMKKGVAWEPPLALVMKTLQADGRGERAYQEARAAAEKEGKEFIDCDASLRAPEVRHTLPTPVAEQAKKGEALKLKALKNVAEKQRAEAEADAENAAESEAEAEAAVGAEEVAGPQAEPATENIHEPAVTEPPPQGTIVVENRNKKSSEAKKAKKTPAKAEQAAPESSRRLTLDLQSAAQSISGVSRILNGVFRPPSSVATPSQPPKKRRRVSSRPSTDTRMTETPPVVAAKDTKAESTASLTPSVSAPPSTTSTSKIPLKISLPNQSSAPSIIEPLTSMSSTSPKQSSRASSRIVSRQASVVPKEDPSTPPIASRQSSLRPASRQSITASIESGPALAAATRNLRRNSTPASGARLVPPRATTPKTNEQTAAVRRSRRPQGAVAQKKEDGAAVIKTGRAKRPKSGPKPKDKTAAADDNAAFNAYMRTDIDGKVEIIADDEPRYCICDDVSYGDMIACDHANVKDGCQEWFHMGCVGLHDMPGRTVKWYCPNCRVKLHKGENTNGLVGRSTGRN